MAKKVMFKIEKDGENPKVPVKSDFDVRDILTGLIGSKNILSPDDKAALYGGLSSSLGPEKAAKLMDYAFIFNQRPEIQSLSLDDKLRRFYDMGSKNPEISDVVTKSRSLGYGVIPGMHSSPNVMNQKLSGRMPVEEVSASVNPEVQRRIMLRINK